MVEKQVPCMKKPRKELPDARNWIYIDAAGAPVSIGSTPINATLPMSEIGRIFDLIVYVQAQLDGCNAIEENQHP